MIIPVLGMSVSLPSDYEAIKGKLLQLGISPSGKPDVDRAKLTTALEEKSEKLEEPKFELEKLEKKKDEEKTQAEKLEEEKLGAMLLAEQNKLLLGL